MQHWGEGALGAVWAKVRQVVRGHAHAEDASLSCAAANVGAGADGGHSPNEEQRSQSRRLRVKQSWWVEDEQQAGWAAPEGP